MDQYINRLLQEQGAPDDLDSEVRQHMVAELTSRAVDFLNRRLVDAMDDASIAEFQKLMDSNPEDPKVVQDFMMAHIPNKDEVVAKALMEFRTVYLGDKA